MKKIYIIPSSKVIESKLSTHLLGASNQSSPAPQHNLATDSWYSKDRSGVALESDESDFWSTTSE